MKLKIFFPSRKNYKLEELSSLLKSDEAIVEKSNNKMGKKSCPELGEVFRQAKDHWSLPFRHKQRKLFCPAKS